MNNFVNKFITEYKKIHLKLINDNIISDKFDYKNISFDVPDEDNHGDISINAALVYKKFSNLSVNEIANKIKKELNHIKFINNVEIAGPGFINVYFSKKYLFDELSKLNKLKEKYFISKIGKNKKINIEFISANPTGPLHVAHSRGAVFGDVLSNILNKVGYNVTREYYINDYGNQIKLLGDSLYFRYLQELKLTRNSIDKSFYPGEYLKDIAKIIILKDKSKWIKEKESIRNLYFQKFAINHIMKNIKQDLKNIGIKIDKFTSEKNDIIEKNIINLVFKKLKKNNLLYLGTLEKPKGNQENDWESREQLLFKSSAFGDDNDRPFLKSNNEWTYFANDSAYHFDKISRGFFKLINIWGSDHIGYIKRMKSIVHVLSEGKIELNIKVCQLVHLKKNNKPIRMSKRSGNFITLKEVTNEVGCDALRYFMLSRKNDAQMDFDLTKVVEKSKDNPIFYVNYAYARFTSLLNAYKKTFKNVKNENIPNFEIFNSCVSNYEWKIIKKILSWPYILESSALSEEPHKIIYYLESLSTLFHSFWNLGKENIDYRFIDKSNLNKTLVKVYIIRSLQLIFQSAFEILGIKPMKKM
tara:strand:- start:63 stop:1817 length:1755 start_codon:yes stop_codon:yes gene_type:complete